MTAPLPTPYSVIRTGASVRRFDHYAWYQSGNSGHSGVRGDLRLRMQDTVHSAQGDICTSVGNGVRERKRRPTWKLQNDRNVHLDCYCCA